MAREPSSSGSNTRRLITISLTTIVLGACTNPFASTPEASEQSAAASTTAIVEFVVDGDTLDLVIDGQEERVRLIGVDTPESVSPNTPEQCFGREASDALEGLLPPGAEVRIERDVEGRDRYGRLLLYIRRVDDDLFVNRWLLEQGFADVLFFEPNTTFETDFTSVRNTARTAGVGLWAACDGADQPLE